MNVGFAALQMNKGFGTFGCLPVIWTLPAAFVPGAAAAGGIAAINSLGNLAGFFGPYVMGWIKDSTGGFGAGLLCLGGAGLVGGRGPPCCCITTHRSKPRRARRSATTSRRRVWRSIEWRGRV